jgi:iron uptake system EfeUOB component EfeO/EfeM
MITLARQIQLKIKKFDELMIKYKIEHLKDYVFYSKLHKLDEKIQEISKLVDNNKD